MAVETSLILIAVIMFIGFIGNLIFKKTDVPSMIWLLLLGVLVGPVLHIFPQAPLVAVSEFFAAVALIIILFESGIDMDIRRILKEAPIGSLFTVVTFTVSVVTVTAIMMVLGLFIPGITLLHGILLGAIVGGTSSAIVIPIVSKLNCLNEKTKMILSIESALTDILCIVVAIAVIQAMVAGSADFLMVFQGIATSFSVGIMIGLLSGFGWLPLMRKLENAEFSYVTTVGLMFLVFSLTQILNGSGAIACLTFGVVLGNGRRILSAIGYEEQAYQIDSTTRTFHTLISFFVRTFFFVFLGLLVSIQDPANIAIGILISAGLLATRPIIVKYLLGKKPELKELDKRIIAIMFPRGLAAAVLAYLPISQMPNDPVIKSFADITFTVILTTAIMTTAGVIYAERKEAVKENGKKEAEKIEEIVTETKFKKPVVDVSPLSRKKTK